MIPGFGVPYMPNSETPLVAAVAVHLSSGYRQIHTSIDYRCSIRVIRVCVEVLSNFSRTRCLESIQCWNFLNQIHTRSSDCSICYAFYPICLALPEIAHELTSNLALRFIDSTIYRAISSFTISFVIYSSGFFVCACDWTNAPNQYINALCSIAWKIFEFLFGVFHTVCFNPKKETNVNWWCHLTVLL